MTRHDGSLTESRRRIAAPTLARLYVGLWWRYAAQPGVRGVFVDDRERVEAPPESVRFRAVAAARRPPLGP